MKNLITFSEGAVKRLPFAGEKVGFDPTMIITIITSLMALCQQRGEKLLAAIKDPGPVQSWRFERIVSKTCNGRARRRFQGDESAVSAAVREQAAGLTLEELNAIVKEVEDEDD